MTLKARLDKLEAIRPQAKYKDWTPLQRAKRIVELLASKSVYRTLTDQEEATLEHYRSKTK